MDERITLKDIKAKSNKADMSKMVEIKADQVSTISDQAKLQGRKEEIDRKNKIKEDEIMKKVDERIANIAVEKEMFNELKQAEIERRKAENEILEKSNNDDIDFDIPEDFSEDDKEDYIVIEDVNISEETIPDSINKLNIQEEKITTQYNESFTLKDRVEVQENIILENPQYNECFRLKKDIVEIKENNIKEDKPIEETTRQNILINPKDFEDLDEKKEDEIKDYITEDEIGYNSGEESFDDPIEDDVKDISFSKEETDAMFEVCKEVIKKITKPSIHTDISSFKIGSAINSTNAVVAKTKDVVEHVLWNSKRTIAIEEFEGYETNLICSQYDSDRGLYPQVIERLKIFYNHIKSKKPKDLKTWLKNIPSTDLNHLWFGGYIASFKDANFSANQCTNCQAPFISEDISINNMIKFENKDAKAKFYNLLNSPNDSLYTIEAKGYRISEQYLFMLKTPSIWSSDVEPLILSEEFRSKYQTVLNLLKFIDKIYFVDINKQELRPIDFWSAITKDASNRNEKVLRNKVRKYAKIITEELSVAEYNYLLSKISSIVISEDTDLVYQLPERKCPKCNKVLEAVEQSAEQLLFTHHQQVLLGNI